MRVLRRRVAAIRRSSDRTERASARALSDCIDGARTDPTPRQLASSELSGRRRRVAIRVRARP